MISLTHTGPWSMLDELAALQDDFNQLFGDRRLGHRSGRHQYPALNLWQSADAVVVDVALPGVDPDKVEISVQDGALTVAGQRTAPEGEAEVLQRCERPTGAFTRTVRLPFRVDADQVKATYKHGVLRISLPRAESDKPKRIAVQVA